MTDELYMQEAIKEGLLASKKGEWPVGCILVLDGKIIARAHNLSHRVKHKLAHAEILAFLQVDSLLRQRPQQVTLYTTCAPCPMCFGACLIYKIKRVVFGADPEESGGLILLKHLPRFYDQPKFALEIVRGVLEKECHDLFISAHPKKYSKTV